MLLIRNANLYNPEKMGKKDILIAGNKFLEISDHIEPGGNLEIDIIDASGLVMIPGLIDAHVHIAGAGGEGGPQTRTPELKIKQLIEGGITTVIGCLGTDGYTRNIESVLMKVKAIRSYGLSAWMYTGAYQVPVPTLTGEIGKDIALFDEIIGVGEVAVSDHRSSVPQTAELIRIAASARVGGMLGGKAGIVNIHMGDAKNPFRPIEEAVENSELKYTQFYPTHCNRNKYIFEDAKKYGKKGYIDLTTSSYAYFPEFEIKPSLALVELLKAGVPVEHITMTSDGNGSLPHFDEKGNLVQLEMGQPSSMLTELSDMVRQDAIPMETALKTITSNPADILKLPGKGKISKDKDADFLLINNNMEIVHMVANGRFFVRDKKQIVHGNYE
jgi:beta-aspartyl-dipeptidase (metallo-type)